jgi:hypothetical protein
MAVQNDAAAAIERGLDAFLDLVKVGIHFAIEEWVALFNVFPLSPLVAIVIILLLFWLAPRWILENFLWGLISLAITAFIIGGIPWIAIAIIAYLRSQGDL